MPVRKCLFNISKEFVLRFTMWLSHFCNTQEKYPAKEEMYQSSSMVLSIVISGDKTFFCFYQLLLLQVSVSFHLLLIHIHPSSVILQLSLYSLTSDSLLNPLYFFIVPSSNFLPLELVFDLSYTFHLIHFLLSY